MIRIILFAATIVLSALTFAQGTPIAIDSTNLTLDGSNVDLKFRIAGIAQPVRDVKILFCGCDGISFTNPNAGFTENATLQSVQDWFFARTTGQTTVKQMLLDGWTIQSIVPRGGSAAIDQFYVIFVR